MCTGMRNCLGSMVSYKYKCLAARHKAPSCISAPEEGSAACAACGRGGHVDTSQRPQQHAERAAGVHTPGPAAKCAPPCAFAVLMRVTKGTQCCALEHGCEPEPAWHMVLQGFDASPVTCDGSACICFLVLTCIAENPFSCCVCSMPPCACIS